MNATVEDLRPTIIPKSDQLNAEQLLGGPMTITVTSVQVSDSTEQPLIVHYEGEQGRPYKPSKTQRKVLLFAWGQNGNDWVGRSMTLYNDPTIKFGGMAVGGIRISHMSDIERDIDISLTATKGKKAMHKVLRLVVAAPVRLDDVLRQIAAATSRPQMAAARAQAELLANEADYQAAGAAYAARGRELSGKASPPAAAPAPAPAVSGDFAPEDLQDDTPPY